MNNISKVRDVAGQGARRIQCMNFFCSGYAIGPYTRKLECDMVQIMPYLLHVKLYWSAHCFDEDHETLVLECFSVHK